MSKYIAYYRVSTQKQGTSGLGLEAQKNSVGEYLNTHRGELINEFVEVQSGKDNNRPQLKQALDKCKLTGATLLIAKLDRLSRNASFLMSLQEDPTINFVACDMPEANRLTISLMSCMADYERRLISERTKKALQVAKARGVKLGNPNIKNIRGCDIEVAREARSAKARQRTDQMREVIKKIQASTMEKLTLTSIAERLNDAGYTTPRGGNWKPTSVSRVLKLA